MFWKAGCLDRISRMIGSVAFAGRGTDSSRATRTRPFAFPACSPKRHECCGTYCVTENSRVHLDHLDTREKLCSHCSKYIARIFIMTRWTCFDYRCNSGHDPHYGSRMTSIVLDFWKRNEYQMNIIPLTSTC
jgi:hypothetical protein